jgi:hypothetical protein
VETVFLEVLRISEEYTIGVSLKKTAAFLDQAEK